MNLYWFYWLVFSYRLFQKQLLILLTSCIFFARFLCRILYCTLSFVPIFLLLFYPILVYFVLSQTVWNVEYFIFHNLYRLMLCATKIYELVKLFLVIWTNVKRYFKILLNNLHLGLYYLHRPGLFRDYTTTTPSPTTLRRLQPRYSVKVLQIQIHGDE